MIKRKLRVLTIAGAIVIGLIAGSLSFGPISYLPGLIKQLPLFNIKLTRMGRRMALGCMLV